MSNFYHIIKGIYLMLVLCILSNLTLHSQSLFPQVIASTGAYQSNAAGSLSFTIGETNTQTLTSATHMLTQGFQQPFELNLINVKTFLQGYYIGAGQMNDVLFNQGMTSPSLLTDSITLELHNATSPYALAFLTKTTILQNGTVNVKGMGAVGQSYYIVLKHRNSLETWSASPILLQPTTTYDFSTSANQAYGGNQIEVEPNVWALYSGDINQDMVIDAFDYVELDPDIIIGASGYLATDLTGDGVVDAFDYLILDPNLTNGVGAVTP